MILPIPFASHGIFVEEGLPGEWHVLFYGDYGRAEILSCVSTVFVLIPMYHFIRVQRGIRRHV